MYQARTFWLSLVVSHLLGWTFLGLASWRLPHLIEPAEGTGFWRRLLSGEIARRQIAAAARACWKLIPCYG